METAPARMETDLVPRRQDASRPPEAGTTVGVEEEYHIVDAGTFALRHSRRLNQALQRSPDFGLQAEISTTQIEAATPVCTGLGQVRAEIIGMRRRAAAEVAPFGATILAIASHPFASWADQGLTTSPRYLAMLERWRFLALQQGLGGCHVHACVPDLETAVAVMDRIRPYLPALLALTGSSPFHESHDTGHESFRTVWFSRWPLCGPTEPFGDTATYQRVVAGLEAGQLIDGAA